MFCQQSCGETHIWTLWLNYNNTLLTPPKYLAYANKKMDITNLIDEEVDCWSSHSNQTIIKKTFPNPRINAFLDQLKGTNYVDKIIKFGSTEKMEK